MSSWHFVLLLYLTIVSGGNIVKRITPRYGVPSIPEKKGWRWLVRESSEPVSKGTVCRSVVAKDVSFVDADAELGYGCFVVAEASDVVTDLDAEITSDFVSVIFDGLLGAGGFFANGSKIYSCKELILEPNGKFWARL